MKKEDFKEGVRFRIEGDGKTVYTVFKVYPSSIGLNLKSRKKRLKAIGVKMYDDKVEFAVPVMNQWLNISIPFSDMIILKNKTTTKA